MTTRHWVEVFQSEAVSFEKFMMGQPKVETVGVTVKCLDQRTTGPLSPI